MTLIFLINSLFIFGIFASTGEGMLLGFVRNWHLTLTVRKQRIRAQNGGWAIDPEKINKYTQPEWVRYINKPLFDCPTCMASLWGTVGFLFTGLSLLYLPVWVVCLSGFNYLVIRIYQK